MLSAARAAEVAPSSARARADAHFLAGFDHFRSGRVADARREWSVCREIDETNDFCEFGLSVLDAGAPKAEAAPEAEPRPATEAPPDSGERAAQQRYLEGVIFYQKGDYEAAGKSWARAKELAAPGTQAAADAQAGLGMLDKLGVAKTPSPLKDAPEKRDEHESLQTYFTGLIYYQKGDLARARTEWRRALALAPKGSSVESDAKAGLERLDKDEASTRGERKK